jgi:hypothetical protein
MDAKLPSCLSPCTYCIEEKELIDWSNLREEITTSTSTSHPISCPTPARRTRQSRRRLPGNDAHANMSSMPARRIHVAVIIHVVDLLTLSSWIHHSYIQWLHISCQINYIVHTQFVALILFSIWIILVMKRDADIVLLFHKHAAKKAVAVSIASPVVNDTPTPPPPSSTLSCP